MAQARTIVPGEVPEPSFRLGIAVQEDGSAAAGRLRIATTLVPIAPQPGRTDPVIAPTLVPIAPQPGRTGPVDC